MSYDSDKKKTNLASKNDMASENAVASENAMGPVDPSQNADSPLPDDRPDIISNAEKYGIDIVGLDLIDPAKYNDSKWPIARTLF